MSDIDPMRDFGIEPRSWEELCARIADGECVPIVGAQIRRGTTLPLPRQLAEKWADARSYPLRSVELGMVAEFVMQQKMDKKSLLKDFSRFMEEQERQLPDDWYRDHALRHLARLPFKIFLTTSFDGLLVQAIRKCRPNVKAPIEASCRWHPEDRYWKTDDVDLSKVVPTYEQPIIMYLHGRISDPMSLVLTERDHMAFTADLRRDSQQNKRKRSMLPPPVKDALSGGSWLFVGYGAADHNLRGLLHALTTQIQTTQHSVAIHLQRGEAREGHEHAADEFLTRYFEALMSGHVEVLLDSDVDEFLEAVSADVDELVKARGGR